MEELQSTDILDQEILEDARRKAYRILKNAEGIIKAKSDEWERDYNSALEDLEHKYHVSSQSAIDEIMAILPIDKRRIKAKKIEALVNSAAAAWYESLGRQKVLAILQNELATRIEECEVFDDYKGICATVHMVRPDEAEAIIKKVLPGKSCPIIEKPFATAYPQIIIENHEVRIIASIEKTVAFFLGEKRIELIEALIGKTALGDVDEIYGKGPA